MARIVKSSQFRREYDKNLPLSVDVARHTPPTWTVSSLPKCRQYISYRFVSMRTFVASTLYTIVNGRQSSATYFSLNYVCDVNSIVAQALVSPSPIHFSTLTNCMWDSWKFAQIYERIQNLNTFLMPVNFVGLAYVMVSSSSKGLCIQHKHTLGEYTLWVGWMNSS